MNSHLISETIRKSIEERRRRRQEQAAGKGPVETPLEKGPEPAPEAKAAPELSACAAELDRTVRESILSSFSQWEVTLIPRIEEMARQVALNAASTVDSASRGSAGHATPGVPGSPGPGGAVGLGGGDPPGPADRQGDLPDKDSWDALAEAVRELRQEWDRETFESRFGTQAAPPSPSGEAMVPFPPPVAGSQPPAAGETDLPAASHQPPASSSPPPAASLEPPAASLEPPAVPDELAAKLDELIRLVKKSIAGPNGERPPLVPPELTRELAREIAGRLKGAMGASSAGPPAGPPAGTPPAPNRIPLDDVASMIDQITGSTPP